MISDEKKVFIKYCLELLKPFFDTCEQAELWLYTENPEFGYISPIAMFNLGKEDKVLEFIRKAKDNWEL